MYPSYTFTYLNICFRYLKMSGKLGGLQKINQTKLKYQTQNQMKMTLLNGSKITESYKL